LKIFIIYLYPNVPHLKQNFSMRLKGTFLFLFFIFSTFVNAQGLQSKLQIAFQKFSNDEQLKYATVSFTVLNASSGELIYGSGENTGVATASTLKTVTSATALALLGEDYTFKTEVNYSGNIENGILNGDLMIKGGGDPTLGSWRWDSTTKNQVLNKILFALQQKGIKEITGKIIGDNSLWDSQSLPTGWIWQDIGNYYGAGTSALTWGENQFELTFSPGKSLGSDLKILNEEAIYPFLEIKNELTTGNYGSGDNVYAYSAPYTNLIYLRGTYGIDLKKKIGLSLPNPALAMAYELRQYLQKNNISSAAYTTSRITPTKSSTSLIEITSPPLKEIVYWFNQKSINLYGEQLLRILGEKFGKSASTVDGVKTLKKFWEDKGIDPETLNINDGSGLSPADRVTSLTMAKVLLDAKKQTWFPTYFKSLPVHNDMKMKSGTISDVLGYAGYADDNGKTSVCFSIIINNYSGSSSSMRQKIYQLLNNLK
jgi:D-alanyl-D-alanine carboxypeptidase/D-alanyl-D-alanine-endopeptidase (penicillin-binding protein 4)